MPPRTVGPFLIYLTLSFLFFGRGLVGHLSDRYIGIGTDPGLFIFFLEWWRYVFTHHLNPFFTYLQWAPSGANLTWATCIPLFGICAIPLTATLGPIATFNLMVLLCPALAAWTAFLLCRYLSSSFWAAVVGGYTFGFSPYMLAHLLGHLAVLMMFPAPLMVLITLRRLNEEISARKFAITLSILIVVLFLCWPEAVATSTLFAGATIAIAMLIAPQWRARLLALVVPFSCAYVASAIILSPYLYYFFAFGQPAFPGGLRPLVSVHPLSFLIPSPAILIGLIPKFRELCGGSHIYETGAYIALPLLLIVVNFARANWHEWRVRLMVNLLIVVCLASLGSTLSIGRSRPLPMPWAIVAHLPLMDKALPARFSTYGCLILAIILSLWLSDGAVRKNLRMIGACGVVLFTLPNLSKVFWTTTLDTPAFFSTGEFKHYVAPGDSVLILPYGQDGNSNIWQATSGFYFRMAGGYLGQPPIPAEYLPYFPIVYNLYNLADFPLAGDLLKMLLVQKQVNAVVIADQGANLWRNTAQPGPQFPEAIQFDSDERTTLNALFATLRVAPVRTGGVIYYRVPLEQMDAYKNADPGPLEARIASIQLNVLIHAAAQYVADGHPLADLNPVEVQRLGLLPPRWISGVSIYDPRAPIQNGLVLTSMANGRVVVGVIGTHGVLSDLLDSYRTYAKQVELSPLLETADWAESTRWVLLLEYDSNRLASAVPRVRQR
jgi:hypothetical protein